MSRDNGGSGLYAIGNTATVFVTINASRFDDNVIRVFGVQGSQVSVTGSVASGNSLYGFAASANGGSALLNVSNSTANNVGVQSGGGSTGAVVRINGVSVSGNNTGLAVGTNGLLVSFGNNFNSDSGSPSSTIAPR